MTHFHEWTIPLWVQTPLGEGRCLGIYDYSHDWNGIMLVQLNDGRFKYFDTNQCRGCENNTLDIARPAQPKE